MTTGRHVLLTASLLVSVMGSLVLVAGCGPGKPKSGAEIDAIDISTIGGTADDGDASTRPTPSNHQYASPGATSATDGQTKAETLPPAFNEVSCDVKAIPGSGATKEAVAHASSDLISNMTVNDSGTYLFTVTLSVTGAKLTGNGTIAVFVRANVMNDSGLVMPGGAIAFKDINLVDNGTKAIVGVDTSSATPVDANGNFTKTFAGPANGIKLEKGPYKVEIVLRSYVTAPDKSSTAAVKVAKLHISVKK